jgi:Ca2+/Na+ antiporter
MFLIDAVFVFFVVLLVASMFWIGTGRFGPWPEVFWILVLMFFGTWAIGSWFRPMGPAAWGVFWLSYVIAAVAIALLLAAATPRRPRPSTRPPGETEEADQAAATTINAFFWLALVLAIAAVIGRYVIDTG